MKKENSQNLNFSPQKSVEIIEDMEDVVKDSFVIDKIWSFQNYFPQNNFEEIVRFNNINANLNLETIKRKGTSNEKEEEVKKMIRITKSKTIRNKNSVNPPEITVKSEKKQQKSEVKPIKGRKRFSIFSKRDKDSENDSSIKSPNYKLSPLLQVPVLNDEELNSEDEKKTPESITPLNFNLVPTKSNLKKQRKSFSCDGDHEIINNLRNMEMGEKIGKMPRFKRDNSE